MAYVERDSRRIYYEVTGSPDAPPVLLVMGLGISARAWDLLPSRLETRFRVIVLDNAGTGRSDPFRGALRMRHMADDAAAVLDGAGVQQASVFGISMGGMIALELVLRHPRRVRALALGATFAGWLRSKKPRLATQRDLLVPFLFRSSDRLGPLSRILVSPAFLSSRVDGQTGLQRFARWLSIADPALPLASAKQTAAILLHHTERRLPLIQAPTLVLSGDADRLVPVENSRRLARWIPGARLVELPGAGHCFVLERLDETARLLAGFFA